VENPHARAAIQMEHQVSDAVRGIVDAPPDVVFAEHVEAPLDFREITRAKKGSRVGEQGYVEHGVTMGGVISGWA
jgi:hypothetical protein